MANQFQYLTKLSFIENRSIQKCSGPHFLTFGYF